MALLVKNTIAPLLFQVDPDHTISCLLLVKRAIENQYKSTACFTKLIFELTFIYLQKKKIALSFDLE